MFQFSIQPFFSSFVFMFTVKISFFPAYMQHGMHKYVYVPLCCYYDCHRSDQFLFFFFLRRIFFHDLHWCKQLIQIDSNGLSLSANNNSFFMSFWILISNLDAWELCTVQCAVSTWAFLSTDYIRFFDFRTLLIFYFH